MEPYYKQPFFKQLSCYSTSRLAANYVRKQQEVKETYNGVEYVCNLYEFPKEVKNIIKIGSGKGCLDVRKCPTLAVFFKTLYALAYEKKKFIYFVLNDKGQESFACSDFFYEELAALCER